MFELSVILLISVVSLVFSGCQLKAEEKYEFESDIEIVQLFSDTMSSIDESGGQLNGNITRISHPTGDEKFYARINKTDTFTARLMKELFIPVSYADSCSAAPFYTCNNGRMIRAFTGCTVQGPLDSNNQRTYGTLSGSIELTFTGGIEAQSCNIPHDGNNVRRIPNYTLTGLRGASFSVTAPTTGQLLTRVGGGDNFSFENAGITRTVKNSDDEKVFEMTTTTSSPLLVAGATRNGRTVSSGSVVVTDNLSGLSCTFTASAATTWANGCNCPTSGNWTGTCSDASSFNIVFNSTCGEVVYTKGSGFKSVTLDRCQP